MPTHSPSGRLLHWWERIGLWLAIDVLMDHRDDAFRMGREAGQRQGFLDAEGVSPQRLKASYLAGYTDGIVSALQEPGEPSTTARAPVYIDRKELDQCFRDSDFDLRHTSESLRHTLRPGETLADDHEPHDACTTTAPGYGNRPGDDSDVPLENVSPNPPERAFAPLSLGQQIRKAEIELATQRADQHALYDIEKVGKGVRCILSPTARDEQLAADAIHELESRGIRVEYAPLPAAPAPVLGGLAGDGLDAEDEDGGHPRVSPAPSTLYGPTVPDTDRTEREA